MQLVNPAQEHKIHNAKHVFLLQPYLAEHVYALMVFMTLLTVWHATPAARDALQMRTPTVLSAMDQVHW